ncbi:MAG: T9SS type A sorting domain-containing protein [Ignavibacteriaceae bacterium]|nr:T9SS type A sorting domain-containing protein [Ignavibacteria bacterium]NNJ54098.1 T9SS type A sorting domain-containing protein [Ignavibacteriaceae bacterium]
MKKITYSLFYMSIIISFTISNVYAQSLPTQSSNIFSGSGNCQICHEPGPPNNNALRDVNGNDISPVTLWRSTMMGNAAKDPLWQAKVTAEVTAHPQYQDFIEDKCTTCHAPLGRTEAHYNGAQYYSLQEMQNDPLALDGVSCTACHQIKADNLGTGGSFSGNYIIENDRLIYGPFENPFAMPMQQTVNYTPVFGEQTHQSELCATCHTLFTPTLNNQGNIVGEIAEQTPYLEWVNSIFPTDGESCQHCHMPEIEEGVVISNRPIWLDPRSPFVKHFFVGANVFMLKILRDNGAQIGVTATTEQFDSTIARTMYLLQNQTANISAEYNWISFNELEIKVAVENLSGHKFPTGYPSRRTWINIELIDENNQPVFSSGDWDNQTGEINGLNMPYEQHHNVITEEDQVQIYQALMEDVDGNVTYTLLRGASYIKDNRLPPEGFTSTGPYYDSTRIEGLALQDPNFNGGSISEGTGIDTITYRINNLMGSNIYTANVKMLYQTTTPRFIADLFQYNTPEVNIFETYYETADKSPVLIDSLQLVVSVTGIENEFNGAIDDYKLFDAYPNPFNSSTIIGYQIPKAGLVALKIYDVVGKEVETIVNEVKQSGNYKAKFTSEDLPSGIYFYKLLVNNFTQTKKMILLK